MNSNHPLDLTMEGLAGGPASPGSASASPSATASASASNKKGAPRRKPTPSQQPVPPGPTQRKRAKSRPFNPLIEFFRGARFRLGLGTLLLVTSVVLLIVSINFLKSGPIDQSVVDSATVMQAADAPEGIQNAGGAVGAKLAQLLMVNGLGVGSFLLVVYTFVLSMSLFKFMRCRFWPFTFKCLFTAIASSIIFGLLMYHSESTFHWGGNHGRYINQWLYHVSDALGAYAVSVVLVGLLGVIYINQLSRFYKSISAKFAEMRTRRGDDADTANATPTAMPVADADDAAAKAFASSQAEAAAFTATTVAASATPKNPDANLVGFTIDEDDEVAGAPVRRVADRVESAGHEPEFTIRAADGDGMPVVSPADVSGLAKTDDPFASLDEMPPINIRDELAHYAFPTPDLLIDRPITAVVDTAEQQEYKDEIVRTLREFNIPISRIEATVGPTVTLFEIVPAEGVRIAQIKRLEDDIAMKLAALGIRIIAPIPGRGTVGIEVPNRKPQTVSMRSVVTSAAFRDCKMLLPMALGRTINNEVFIADLAKIPHLLVAGATGQGKSVGLNCIIASLLYKKHPGELKFVLIDPKMVEFSLYSRLEKHFLAKLPDEEDAVVTDAMKALSTLNSLCVEMDNRYELLKSASVRTLEEYNEKFTHHRLNPEKGHRYMPYIVVIVDEFADLIMTAGKDISTYIARIAQKARAVGMHMIIATQRPSTDIITGMIKANFPGRIAFRVAQMVDSKTILDRPGANRLIGRGDMLFDHSNHMQRVQCAFIDTPEVDALVSFIDAQIGYSTAYILPEPVIEGASASAPGSIDLSKRDDMFDECARFVVQNSTASTSSLQRRFSIGYNKAGKIMDQLEAAGIVGPADGQRPRTVLVDSVTLEDIIRAL